MIVEIQVFYRDLQDELHEIKQAPSDQDSKAIKMDVARIIKPIKESKTADYYYVVLKVKRTDGTIGYRTVIGKTQL